MANPSRDSAAEIRRQLEIDQVLGVKQVPLRPGLHHALHGGPDVPATVSEGKVDQAARLAIIDEKQVQSCRKCALSESRTRTVFGQGHCNADLVFVGEAPGYEEDQQGLAFVGRAGQLLTRMIAAMGLQREQVFICNVLKCRPPNNRTPAQDEIAACSPYLFEQLRIIQPRVICALGAPAAQTLLGTREGIGRIRGRFHDFELSEDVVIPLMPTYHPAYLLRSPGEKRKAWEDLKLIMDLLGLREAEGSPSSGPAD